MGQKQLAGNLPPETPVWVPDEPNKWWRSIKLYVSIIWCFTAMRNGGLHRKWFALLKFGFEHWDAPLVINGQEVEKNKDTFREWVTVRCGYYTMNATPDGKMRVEAKSIAWDKMGDEEFTELYENTKNLFWKTFFQNYTEEDWERIFLELNSF